MRWLNLTLGVTLTVVASPLAAQDVERFSLTGDRVVVSNLVGEIRVERGTGNAVVVEVTRMGADADRLTIKTGDVEGGWRSLSVVFPDDRIIYPKLGRFSRSEFDVRDDGTFGGRVLRATLTDEGFDFPSNVRIGGGRTRIRVSGGGSGTEAAASLRVLVPQGVTVAVLLGVGRVNIGQVNGHVRVEAMSGSVTASGVDGSLLIHTGSGGINISQARGHVRLDTGSGSIDADGVSNGSFIANTGSGGIDVVNVESSGVKLDTGSGSVRIDGMNAPALDVSTGSGGIRAARVSARDLEMTTGSGSINLDLMSDVRNARVNTGSGGVTMTLPSVLGAELFVDTGSGGINSDVPMQLIQKKRSSLRGRLGDGQGRLEIDTGSGGVTLRAR